MGTLNLGKLHGVARRPEGAGTPCSVTVYPAGSVNEDGSLIGTPVACSVYADQDGDTTTANPLTADAYGRFACYAAPGAYDLRFTGATIESRGVQNVQVPAAINAAGDVSIGRLPQGSARTFVAADEAHLPTSADVADICYVTDKRAFYHYTGSAWVRQQGRMKLLLPLHTYSVLTIPAAAVEAWYDVVTSSAGVGNHLWDDSEGATFTASEYPALYTARLCACCTNTISPMQGVQVRLYDITAGQAVASSTISVPEGVIETNRIRELRSGPLTLTDGHKYRLQWKLSAREGDQLFVASAHIELVTP